MLSAESILAADDIGQPVEVQVPEWGGSVFVRVMTGGERDRFELAATRSMKQPALPNVRAALCVMCICDDKGERLFRDDQLGELGKKAGSALDRIYEVAARINKLSESDVDDLAGNLNAGQSGDSGFS